MTAEQLAKIQRDFLTRTENQSAVQLAAEFEAVKTEIFNSLLRQNLSDGTARVLSELYRKTFLDKILDDFSVKAGSIVRRAQGRAINFASESLERFLPKIKSSIFAADTDSIQKLIGRTQTGESLVKFFKRFKPIIRQRAQRIFIDSFAEGVSNEAIARRLAQAAGAQKHRVLTISRTETNQAYRAASREFYQAAGIEEYIWLETLDARTCLICWLQHGRVFPSRVKFSNHPNCRGVMVPYFGEKIETGEEKFKRLESGYQKQILGASRFELYQNGAALAQFVGVRESKEFGKTFLIKPLSEIRESGFVFKSTNDAARKYYGAGRLSHPQEWSDTIDRLRRMGVDVRIEGKAMVYGAASRPGMPGNLRIDPDASISALRHEAYHYEHDRARNFPGMRFYFERYAERWRSEFFAYMVELKFAREMRNPALAREIVSEMRQTRTDLRSFYGISENNRKR